MHHGLAVTSEDQVQAHTGDSYSSSTAPRPLHHETNGGRPRQDASCHRATPRRWRSLALASKPPHTTAAIHCHCSLAPNLAAQPLDTASPAMHMQKYGEHNPRTAAQSSLQVLSCQLSPTDSLTRARRCSIQIHQPTRAHGRPLARPRPAKGPAVFDIGFRALSHVCVAELALLMSGSEKNTSRCSPHELHHR